MKVEEMNKEKQCVKCIEKLEERKELWAEFSRKADDYYRLNKPYPRDILRQLGINADYLLLDPYYDCDCAAWIAYEIGTIIEMLKKEEEKRRDHE
jgi:hypothetical protein